MDASLAQRIGALKDDDRRVWEAAVVDLVRLGAAAVSALLESLRDTDWRVCKRSAVALGLMGAGAAPAVEGLVAACAEGFPAVIYAARQALQAMDPSSIPTVVRLLDHTNSDVRWSAVVRLAEYPEEVFAPLLTALTDSSEQVRESAAWALHQHPLLAADEIRYVSVASALIEVLKDPAGYIGELAGSALLHMHPSVVATAVRPWEEAIPVLIEEVASLPEDASGSSPGLTEEAAAARRRYGAFLLGRLGPAAASAVPALLQAPREWLPDDGGRPVNFWGACALGRIQGQAVAEDVIPSLGLAFPEEKGVVWIPEISAEAAEVLEMVGPRGLKKLLRILDYGHTRDIVRDRIVSVLLRNLERDVVISTLANAFGEEECARILSRIG